MQERKEDGQQSKKLEDEVNILRDQVGIAIQKAAANKEYKEKLRILASDNDNLKLEISNLNAQLIAKDSKYLELKMTLDEKDEEISTFSSAKNDLIEKMQTIQSELIQSNKATEDVTLLQQRIAELETAHVKEIEEMKEIHEKELEEVIEKHEEDQVVELNLLDHELDKLRDEKQAEWEMFFF